MSRSDLTWAGPTNGKSPPLRMLETLVKFSHQKFLLLYSDIKIKES